MYTLSDGGTGTAGSTRSREPSPFPGSARRQNDTFTAVRGDTGGSSHYHQHVRSTDPRGPHVRTPTTDTTTSTSRAGTTSTSRTVTMTTDRTGTTSSTRTRAATTAGSRGTTAGSRGTTAGSRATTSNSRQKKHAADDNPFRLPPLSSAEMAYMVRKAKESSIALVDHAHTLDGPVEWQYTGKFRGIQMYRGEGTSGEEASGMEYMCGVTTMAGSLDEVSAYFDQSTTERMRAKKADDVLDCAVLYALERGDAKSPYYRVSVKYTSFEGPSTFSRARDYVYLECQNTFRHASGRRGWVLSMHSIKLPNCPEMDGTVRGSMYHSGYVFVEAEKPGFMDVMHSLQINFKATKRLPSFMLNSALKRRITSVIKISREIQMARMGQQTLLKKEDLMPKNSRSLCANCSRKFTLFIRKTRCRMCGQVVCQSCAPQVDWEIPGEGTKKTRICVKCYRTGGGFLAPSTSTVTSKNSAEYSDDEEMIEEEQAAAEAEEAAHVHGNEEEAAADDGLEEQTEVSVFAQSRFTRTTDSMFSFTSEFHIHDLGASSASVSKTAAGAKTTGGFAWKDTMGTSYDQSGVNALEHSTFDRDMSVNSNFYDTKMYLTAEDTEEELDKRARRYDPDFRETSIVDKRVSRATGRPSSPPPPPPPLYEPISQLSAGALKEHNMRFQGSKKYSVPVPPLRAPAPPTPPQTTNGKLVSIKDIRSNFIKGTEKSEVVPPEPKARPSARLSQDGDYISHPPSVILSQVRANRSRTIQFAPEGDYRSPEMMQSIEHEHNKRMAELNKATSDYNNGYRATEPETNDDDEPFTLEHLQAPTAGEKVVSKNAPMYSTANDHNENRQSTGESARESAQILELDADEYYAPSALELTQVRANRSHTIEFMPEFMPDPEEIDDLDDSDVSADVDSDYAEEEGQEVHVGVQQQQQQIQQRSADVKEQQVTEQTENLQIPVVEMAPSPTSQGKEEDDDEARSRFSQTLIPILDYSTDNRNSEAPSVSGLSIEIETRASRLLSDIPIMDYGLDQSMSSVRESDFDLELINRPTAVIMKQVHANRIRPVQLNETDDDNFRSTEVMKDIEEEHRQRMADLNRIAMDYTGNRISKMNLVDEERESIDTIGYDRLSSSYRNTSQQQLGSQSEDLGVNRASEDRFMAPANSHSFGQSRSPAGSNRSGSDFNSNSHARRSSSKGYTDSRMTSLEFMSAEDLEYKQPRPAIPATTSKSRFTNLEFSLDLLEPRDTIDMKIGSPRESMEFDDELMNRSTTVIMDQVRANRERVPKNMDISEDDFRSTAIMEDIEFEHKKRMAELNQIAIDNIGGRISTFPTGTARDSEDSIFLRDHSMLSQVNTSTPQVDRFTFDLLEPRDTIDMKIGSPRESMEIDDELINRSTAVIMNQVRANRARIPKDLSMSESNFRSTAIMEDIELEHKKRMAELNQIAIDNVGGRISTFPTGSSRDSEDSMIGGGRRMLSHVNTSLIDTDEYSLNLLAPRDTIDMKIGSPRESMEPDDEFINRSTAMIKEQVRGNRERALKDVNVSEGDFRSTAIMEDIELEHKKRMAELNQIAIDNVGGRISTFPTGMGRDSEDSTFDGGPSMLRQVNTSHVDTAWRPTTIMSRYHNAHEAKMESLQRKVDELDDQCRASMASIFSAEELDFAELDAELAAQQPVKTAASAPKYKHRDVRPTAPTTVSSRGAVKGDENSSRIANLYSVKNLNHVAARRNTVGMHEHVSAHTLYQQIAQLTQLQSQMALANDADDEDEFKQRIKEQYQLLRTLKLRGN